jgi:DNA-binding MarR family transcriptional regulator
MEKEGLLERHEGLHKNNAVAWTLTEKGEEDLLRSLDRHEIIDEIYSVLFEDEKNSLRVCLKKLLDTARAKAALSSRFPEPIAEKLGV